MKKIYTFIIFFSIVAASGCIRQKEPVDYVNPFLGTSGNRWMLFPGPCMPFGMVKLSDTEIEGYVKRKAGWSEYILHFVARFNRPFESMGGWQGANILNETDEVHVTEDSDIGAFLKFKLGNDPLVLMKTGISYVSTRQARLNMESEMDKYKWDFDAVHKNARDTWNNLLGKIKVEGRSETDKVKFYTNLYHSYSARTIYSDVNGK
ncbi:MAG: glycoside hydrolase domain-containing protein [Bacteroidales bacterium]